MNLRDHLLSALQSLPGTRTFHLHVLTSAPRKHGALFPFAQPRPPKTYLQDILVLLAEQAHAGAPRVFVSALSAALYAVPGGAGAALLYVAKVDGTGQGARPAPTRALLAALLAWYADPATRPVRAAQLWVQLFARAQRQYLFPNSADFAGKRPLGDVQLCAWWRRVLGDVAAGLAVRYGARLRVRLWYILPGLGADEAAHALAAAAPPASAAPAAAPVPWVYGHPYAQSDVPLPCPGTAPPAPYNLGHLIPYFDDDPKARFLDEIAHTTEADGVRSPAPKRARRAARRGARSEEEEEEEEEGPQRRDPQRPAGDLGAVTPDEFWERMSFRQECIAGAVTGFFALGVSAPPDAAPESAPAPGAPQPGHVPAQTAARVLRSLLTAHEFATPARAARATAVLEGAIRSLCEGLAPEDAARARTHTPEPRTPPRAGALLAPATPPRAAAHALPDVSPNPFPEPVPSLETYHAHIYGSVRVENAPLAGGGGAGGAGGGAGGEGAGAARTVTVLQARKKRRA